MLISCVDFDLICQSFYTASNLKDFFHNIHPKQLISFIHTLCFTNKHFLQYFDTVGWVF